VPPTCPETYDAQRAADKTCNTQRCNIRPARPLRGDVRRTAAAGGIPRAARKTPSETEATACKRYGALSMPMQLGCITLVACCWCMSHAPRFDVLHTICRRCVVTVRKRRQRSQEYSLATAASSTAVRQYSRRRHDCGGDRGTVTLQHGSVPHCNLQTDREAPEKSWAR
jgi:hypothetical protein